MMAAWRVAVRVAAPVGWAAPSREPEALAPAAARAPATLALTPPSRIPATTLGPAAAAQVEATLALTPPSRIPGDAAAGSGGSGGSAGGATGSGGATSLGGTTGSGGATGSGGRDAGTAGATGNTCATGQTPSNFGLVATGDSDPNYTSGVGVLTATEFLVFNAYYGPASTDGGTGANVNRIDVQHFDPIKRTTRGMPHPC